MLGRQISSKALLETCFSSHLYYMSSEFPHGKLDLEAVLLLSPGVSERAPPLPRRGRDRQAVRDLFLWHYLATHPQEPSCEWSGEENRNSIDFQPMVSADVCLRINTCSRPGMLGKHASTNMPLETRLHAEHPAISRGTLFHQFLDFLMENNRMEVERRNYNLRRFHNS